MCQYIEHISIKYIRTCVLMFNIAFYVKTSMYA